MSDEKITQEQKPDEKVKPDEKKEEKKKPTQKQYYIKNEFFNKIKSRIRKREVGKGSKKSIEPVGADEKVDYFNLFIGGQKRTFVKDVALTAEQLKWFEPYEVKGKKYGENLKSYYLVKR